MADAAILLTDKESEKFGDVLSDVICFLKGYRAGRQGETDHSSFINIELLKELNCKVKRSRAVAEEMPF